MKRFVGQKDSPDIEFMTEVDAALQRRGNIWAYRLSYILLGVFLLALLLSLFIDRKEVTRGNGQITPSMGIQPVQSEHGGIIKEIFVKEGQEVRKGDKLVQMSNIEAVSEYQDMLNKQMECILSLKRLDAEASGSPLVFTSEEQTATPEAVHDQMRLFVTRKEKFESGSREIAANLDQKRSAVDEALSRKNQYEQSLVLLKRKVEKTRPLVARGIFSPVEFLGMEQQMVTLEGDLNTLAETIARTRSEVREEETRLSNRASEWHATIAAERNEFRKQLDSINQKVAAGGHLVSNSDLRSPFAGVVKRIILKEEGIAQRAETIMELLPTDDTLEVDARFRPADRGFLEIGQTASVKVTAYEFSIYGDLAATVTQISPDTIEDTKGQAWYEVRLRTSASRLVHKGQELEIKPGMTVTVDVISGEKSIFDYLLKPILKSRLKGNVVGRKIEETADGTISPATDASTTTGEDSQ